MARAASCMSTRCRRWDACRSDVAALGADLVTLSAHKIGGPKGVGALVISGADLHMPSALIRGGGQERNRRAGTENVVGIAGFGAAAKAARANMAAEAQHMRGLRDRLEAGLASIEGVTIFASGVPRLPNTTLFAAERCPRGNGGDRLRSGGRCGLLGRCLFVRQGPGVARSGGHGGRPGNSREGAIRLSTGYATKEGDIDRCLEAWRMLSGVLRKP